MGRQSVRRHVITGVLLRRLMAGKLSSMAVTSLPCQHSERCQCPYLARCMGAGAVPCWEGTHAVLCPMHDQHPLLLL